MQKDQFDLFKQPDYGISRSRDALTSLWRQMLHDLNIDPLTITEKMNEFMRNPRNRHLMLGRSMQSLRGNMRKALLKEDHLSWRWFDRGMRLLGPDWYQVEITCGWRNGLETVHSKRIDLHDPSYDEMADDEPDID